MDDETIKNILIILKVNPAKFCEKDYNKETIKYLKEIVKSSDKLYGNEDSIYLRNQYYKYLHDYCYKNIGLNNDLDDLRKIVFGFFYKVKITKLKETLKNSKDLLTQSFDKLEKLHQCNNKTEKFYELLKSDGIAIISTLISHSLAAENIDNPMISLLTMNAFIANELVENNKEDKSHIDKVVKEIEVLSNQVTNSDPLIFEMLYCSSLARFCNNPKILKLNPFYNKDFYNKEKKTGRVLNKLNIFDLEKKANEYRDRYLKNYSISIDTAIEDIENLQSKDIEDYSFYDYLVFFTTVSLNKIRKKNNMVLENTLLENLYITKLIIETKMENKGKKSKIKKLI